MDVARDIATDTIAMQDVVGGDVADAGIDASLDARSDAAPDVLPDVSPDVSPDVVPDVSPDVLPDVPAMDACVPVLVINEVRATGAMSASDEFVEIYNAGSCEAVLAGWRLRYAAASSDGGTTPSQYWLGVAADRIPAGGYIVIPGSGYTGGGPTTMTGLSSGLGGTGGGVGLYAPDGTLVDRVAYMNAMSFNPFVEPSGGTPAANPPAGQSIARVPNGTDTNNNAMDFMVRASTPGMEN